MEQRDIIKYSHQIVLRKSSKDFLIANGFFVKYETYPYFVTVNHAVEPNLCDEGEAHLVLHANGMELNTRTIKLNKWQFVNLYSFPQTGTNVNTFSFPRFEKREDFAFCQAQITELQHAVSELPYRIQGAASASCHNTHIEFINLPEQLTKPCKDKKFHIAGKILLQSTSLIWEYKSYFYTNMKYVGDFEGLYQFQSFQSATMDDWKGLSGSPVFDDELKLVGMAMRYNEADNILLVYPAEDIAWQLRNDCIPTPAEIEFYNN